AGIDTEHRDAASVRPPQTFQDFDRCGFTRSIRTEQTKDLTSPDFEAHAAQSFHLAIALPQACRFYQNHVVAVGRHGFNAPISAPEWCSTPRRPMPCIPLS